MGDVGVVEAGEDLGLPREPGEPVWVIREGVGEDLQRDLAVELRVGGLPDLAHPTFTKQIRDVVMAEARSRCECHRSVSLLVVPRRPVPCPLRQ